MGTIGVFISEGGLEGGLHETSQSVLVQGVGLILQQLPDSFAG